MTDRDYFAAAALTRGMGVLGYEQIAKSCYEMADAMLRNRERTNHDAAPAARAAELESSVPPGSVAAPANTSEPVAWVVFATDGSDSSAVYSMREQAQAAANVWGWNVAPLYAKLPLTDAEREAIETAVRWLEPYPQVASTLRKLLERMGGQT